MQYILVGNYGVGNVGDEILKDYFLERFSDIEWIICSNDPNCGVPRLPSGIRSLFSFKWIKTIRVLKKSDGMVFGGGSLFTDTESAKACWIWFVHALFAVIFKKPIYLAFQGVGPFRTTIGKALSRWVIKRSKFVIVRDSASYDRTIDMLMKNKVYEDRKDYMVEKNKEVVQSSDPSILLLESQEIDSRTQKMFTVIPRLSTGWKDGGIMRFAKEFEGFEKENCQINIVSMQPDNLREQKLCADISEALHGRVINCNEFKNLSALILKSDLVITQRYHGAVAALSSGVPFVSIFQKEGDKLDAISQMCECSSCALDKLSNKLMSESLEISRQNLLDESNKFIKLAELGEERLKQALSK
jgi:polysaccharide pyruvyl transferase WcaK-like protein